MRPVESFLTPTVKLLLIVNGASWLAIQILARGLLGLDLVPVLGLSPDLFASGFLWQPVTYMFMHAVEPFHLILNMVILVFIGVSLEETWGRRFFLTYYLVSGVGSALIYTIVSLLIGSYPVVIGASGAMFGLILAYGMLFKDRVVLLAFVIPIRAGTLIWVLAGLEIAGLLASFVQDSQISHLAHLGGFAAGYLFLWGRRQYGRRKRRTHFKRQGRNLWLVVNNEDDLSSRYRN